MNTNGKSNFINHRFKPWWNITAFRFYLSINNAKKAKKYLDRIPLPGDAPGVGGINKQEYIAWKKYTDDEGNIRLITLKSVLLIFAKIILFMTIAAAIAWAFFHFNGKIKDLNAQIKNISISHLQPRNGQRLALNNGKDLAVNTGIPPLFLKDKFFLPVLLPVGKEDGIFYTPVGQFAHTVEYFPDCTTALKFALTGNTPLYYVYTPGLESKGKWMEEEEVTSASEKLQPGTGVMVFLYDDMARELRSEASIDAPLIRRLPRKKTVEFMRFAPVASLKSKTLWAEVKSTNEKGQCVRGWVPAFTLDKLYVDIGTEGKPFEVTAQTLTLRDKAGADAAKVTAVEKISKGENVEFIELAPLMTLLTAEYIPLHVHYISTATADKPPKTYDGWIYGGKIVKKNMGTDETPKAPSPPQGKNIKKETPRTNENKPPEETNQGATTSTGNVNEKSQGLERNDDEFSMLKRNSSPDNNK